jgi:hypothetical protein
MQDREYLKVKVKVKDKGKDHPKTGHEVPEMD